MKLFEDELVSNDLHQALFPDSKLVMSEPSPNVDDLKDLPCLWRVKISSAMLLIVFELFGDRF